jgi:hypothetical protein
MGVKVFEMEFFVYDEFIRRPEVNFISLLFCVIDDNIGITSVNDDIRVGYCAKIVLRLIACLLPVSLYINN